MAAGRRPAARRTRPRRTNVTEGDKDFAETDTLGHSIGGRCRVCPRALSFAVSVHSADTVRKMRGRSLPLSRCRSDVFGIIRRDPETVPVPPPTTTTRIPGRYCRAGTRQSAAENCPGRTDVVEAAEAGQGRRYTEEADDYSRKGQRGRRGTPERKGGRRGCMQ